MELYYFKVDLVKRRLFLKQPNIIISIHKGAVLQNTRIVFKVLLDLNMVS